MSTPYRTTANTSPPDTLEERVKEEIGLAELCAQKRIDSKIEQILNLLPKAIKKDMVHNDWVNLVWKPYWWFPFCFRVKQDKKIESLLSSKLNKMGLTLKTERVEKQGSEDKLYYYVIKSK